MIETHIHKVMFGFKKKEDDPISKQKLQMGRLWNTHKNKVTFWLKHIYIKAD